jgi:hypothetical protein
MAAVGAAAAPAGVGSVNAIVCAPVGGFARYHISV